MQCKVHKQSADCGLKSILGYPFLPPLYYTAVLFFCKVRYKTQNKNEKANNCGICQMKAISRRKTLKTVETIAIFVEGLNKQQTNKTFQATIYTDIKYKQNAQIELPPLK